MDKEFTMFVDGSAFSIPKPAGCWVIGGNWRIYCDKAPSWLNRKMTTLLIGWVWEGRDADT